MIVKNQFKTLPPVISLEAKRVILMVREDIASGLVPASVKRFADLHDSVDANEYLIEAGLFEDFSQDEMDRANSVTEEVDRWLEGAREKPII